MSFYTWPIITTIFIQTNKHRNRYRKSENSMILFEYFATLFVGLK